MKILYVKNNSERAKEFQLKTIIYEENGQKFVKKQALCKEAISHLKKMKDSYVKLTNSIINPKIKLAKIVDESEDALTFEFINGVSLESRYNNSLKLGEKESNKIIKEYKELLVTGFKTTKFDNSTMVNDEYKRTFGDFDYAELNGELCLDGISNIDLIFSNIIFKDDNIYLIDYEWVFDLNISIDYIVFRALHNRNNLYAKMEKNFINNIVVNKNGFFNIQNNYLANRLNITQQVQEKENQVQEKENQVQEKENQIQEKENQIQEKENQIYEKEEQINLANKEIQYLNNLAQSLRLKNRIKRFIKKLIPEKLFKRVKKLQEIKYYLKKIFIKIIHLIRVYYNEIKQFLEIPSSNNGRVINKINNFSKSKDKLCIFSHFDKDGIIDDYVIYYLKNLYSVGIDIIFISTAKNITDESISKLLPYCRDIIIKENIGYDFGAWKTGLEYIDKEIESYDSLILCNDSVYAPLYDLSSMINTMKQKEVDFWGVTDSYEVKWHLQSYFLFFNKKVLKSKVFVDFWKHYKIYNIKRNIIEKYEVGLTDILSKEGFKFSAYCPSNELIKDEKINTTHHLWKELIINKKCPIIKIELLRDNPVKVDISNWKFILSNNTSYNVSLIENHIKRIK